MPKFIAISHDEDQQQTFFDRIVAKDEKSAIAAIGIIRDYAIPCAAMTIEELRQTADDLEETPEAIIKAETRRLHHLER